jgi:hypothetical protein
MDRYIENNNKIEIIKNLFDKFIITHKNIENKDICYNGSFSFEKQMIYGKHLYTCILICHSRDKGNKLDLPIFRNFVKWLLLDIDIFEYLNLRDICLKQ